MHFLLCENKVLLRRNYIIRKDLFAVARRTLEEVQMHVYQISAEPTKRIACARHVSFLTRKGSSLRLFLLLVVLLDPCVVVEHELAFAFAGVGL